MYRNESQERGQQEESNMLHQRPQRSSNRRGGPFVFLLLGGVIIIVVAVIVALQIFSHQGSPETNSQGTVTTTNNATPTASSKGSSSLPGEGDPQIYWDTIKMQVAQGLHMSMDQISGELRLPTPTSKSGPPPAGTTIGEIASQQGLSTSQLHTIEINAIQGACNVLVSQHSLSQTDANQRMQMINSWDQSSLDGYIMYAFQNH